MAEQKIVIVSYYGLLATMARARQVELLVEQDATLGDLLDRLAAQYGDRFRAMLLTEDGTLLPYVKVWVEGREATEAMGRATLLGDGCRISLVSNLVARPGGWQFDEPPYIKAARGESGAED